jgi:Tfp pilus assembly protein PilO
MTTRDRTVLIAVVLVAALGAAWLLVVSPEREKASKLHGQIASAQAQLATAESQLTDARGAETKYSAAYEAVVNLGKAVPPSQEVPSLIYQISQASNQKRVDFASIATGTGSGSSTSSSASASAATAASGAATTASSAFTQLPFTFTFEGGFLQLERLFHQLDDFTTLTAPGHVAVSGRLLTVQSVKLAPADGSGLTRTNVLSGTVTATAYVLPASQGLTAGASVASPVAGGATPAAASGTSSPTTPAIVKATP